MKNMPSPKVIVQLSTFDVFLNSKMHYFRDFWRFSLKSLVADINPSELK